MEDQEIGSRPVAYKRDYRGDMCKRQDGDWVRIEDAQEMLDWVRVFVHSIEKGTPSSALIGLTTVIKNRLKDITW